MKFRNYIKNYILLLLIIIITALFANSLKLKACTSFCLNQNNQFIHAKNLDWDINDGNLYVNKRSISKEAFTDGKKIIWTSKFGSITFNQFGKEFPLGGMNEVGLVIEELNSFGLGPQSDSLYKMNEFQWIQYHLDNYSSVNEIVNLKSPIVVKPFFVGLHYIISDKKGDVAIIEFYNDKHFIYHGNDIIYPILSNNKYSNSLNYIQNFIGFGGDLQIRNQRSSNERFVKAAYLIKKLNNNKENSLVKEAFAILDSLKQHDTQWSIVYNISDLQIEFKTSTCPYIKTINLKKFDFSCDSPIKFHSVTSKESGNIDLKFEVLEPHINTKLLSNVFEKYIMYELGDLKKEEFLDLSNYGNSIHCNKQNITIF